jgi:hypothetical protein
MQVSGIGLQFSHYTARKEVSERKQGANQQDEFQKSLHDKAFSRTVSREQTSDVITIAMHNRKNFIEEQKAVLARFDMSIIETRTPEYTSMVEDLEKSGIIESAPFEKLLETIYSGSNASGLSFELGYAESSTRDNPMMIARGIDENGNPFEKTIHVNNINPYNATYLEMQALAVHLMPDEASSVISQGDADKMGLNDKADFSTIFAATSHAQLMSKNLSARANTHYYVNTIFQYAISVNEDAATEDRIRYEDMIARGAQRVFMYTSEIYATTVNGIEHLSAEQKAMLKEKYDINNIKPGSAEYNMLMYELMKLGVISNILSPEILKAHHIGVDENGFITGILSRADEPQTNSNILDWFRGLLNTRVKEYSQLQGRKEFTDEQAQLYEFLIDHKRDLKRVLEEIFGK